MLNPILQQMQNRTTGNSILGMLRNNNPQQVFQNLMQSNPQFQQFVNANQGKSIQQIAAEHGIPMSTITNMMGGGK